MGGHLVHAGETTETQGDPGTPREIHGDPRSVVQEAHLGCAWRQVRQEGKHPARGPRAGRMKACEPLPTRESWLFRFLSFFFFFLRFYLPE